MKVPTRLLALSSPLSSKLFSIGGLGSHLIEGPSDYHLNLGKAVDTLRHDYPRLFVASPHMEIYHPKIELLRVDPGSDKKRVVIKGRERYEKMFSSQNLFLASLSTSTPCSPVMMLSVELNRSQLLETILR